MNDEVTPRLEIPRDWSFKKSDVAADFDRHVREQLPWYDLVSGAIAHIVRHYLPEGGKMYDVGASTGNIGQLVADTLAARSIDLIALEASADMAALYQGPGVVEIVDATEYEFAPFDVAVCNLVLMFIPVCKRTEFVKRLVSKCRKGGAVIVVDKTIELDGYFGSVLYRLTLAGKVAAGVDAAAIVAKELSLAGVQRPLEPDSELVGFREWFRFGCFAGWLYQA